MHVIGKELPREALSILVTEKLEIKGVKLSKRQLARLVNHVFEGRSSTLQPGRWRWRKSQNIVLEFTEEDVQRLEETVKQGWADALSVAFVEILDKTATDILLSLRRGLPSELRRQRRERTGFERRLARRYKTPLDLLWMLLTVSREYGGSINQELRNDSDFHSQPHLVEVLTRLHARACQVTYEVLVLLQSGLADGAVARWRSLHEIAVVAMFLHEHGEEFAERYVEHQHVEARQAARNYVRCQGRLGYEPLRPEELAKIEASAEIAIDRFGAAFEDQYGWASGTLKKKGITFADIERAVGVGHLRAHYQLACHNVHANPRGAFYRLGLSNEPVLLAGVSDQGMSDPAHLTAISLTQCSAPLGLMFPTVDNLVALKIMMQVERDIGQALEDYLDQSSTAVSDP